MPDRSHGTGPTAQHRADQVRNPPTSSGGSRQMNRRFPMPRTLSSSATTVAIGAGADMDHRNKSGGDSLQKSQARSDSHRPLVILGLVPRIMAVATPAMFGLSTMHVRNRRLSSKRASAML
jgi:hypothetical protein